MSARRDHGYNISGQTEEGPPIKNGVLNVIATLQQTPWHTTRLVACFFFASVRREYHDAERKANLGRFRQGQGTENLWRREDSRWLD